MNRGTYKTKTCTGKSPDIHRGLTGNSHLVRWYDIITWSWQCCGNIVPFTIPGYQPLQFPPIHKSRSLHHCVYSKIVQPRTEGKHHNGRTQHLLTLKLGHSASYNIIRLIRIWFWNDGKSKRNGEVRSEGLQCLTEGLHRRLIFHLGG